MCLVDGEEWEAGALPRRPNVPYFAMGLSTSRRPPRQPFPNPALFSLKLLGGALLESADGPVRGRAAHRRRIALLALLAAAGGRPVAREKLIGLLWPEHPGDAARHLLSEALYVLRKALGDGVFVVVGDEVALNAGVVESDLGAFWEAVEGGDAERAVALYRGPFLDGFYLSAADEFERWAETERDRVARAFAAMLERLAEAGEAEGDFLVAAGWWRRLAAHDPYSSRVVLRLMHALESGGEHTAALRAATEHTDFLRDDLGAQPDPAVPTYAERLRTAPVHGVVPPIPEPGSQRAPLPAADAEPAPPVSAPPPPERPAPVADAVRGRPARRAVAVLAVAALVAVLVGMAVRGGRPAPPAPTAGAADPRRIAVLYFEDDSRGDTLRHIAGDLTARIIDELAQLPSLRVVSTNGVRPYRERDVPLDSVARVLGVGTVVAGSVQGSGDRLRVVVRLLDPATGRQLASRLVVRRAGDLIALEEEVVRQVADFLRPRLGREIRLAERSAGTRSAAAREVFLRGQQRWEDARVLGSGPGPLDSAAVHAMLRGADSLLAEAARLDPKWAEPLVIRGWVALSRSDFRGAVEEAERALARQPESPAALELRGTARWRMVQLDEARDPRAQQALANAAQRDLNVALAADPSLARAWATLSQLLRVHRALHVPADQAARRALEADEFLEEAPAIVDRLYRTAVQLARFDSAGSWCERGRRRFPDDYRFVECRLTLLGYEGVRPDVDLAWRLVRELEQMDPPNAARPYNPVFRRMLVARVAARASLADSARALVLAARAAVRGDTLMQSSQWNDEAYVRVLLGEPDSAIVLLERHVGVHARLREQVANNVKFRSLHADPRFRRLVAEAPEAAR